MAELNNELILLAKELMGNGLKVYYPKISVFSGSYFYVTNGMNTIIVSYEKFNGLRISFKIKPSLECGSSAVLCYYDNEKKEYVDYEPNVENIKKILSVKNANELKCFTPYIKRKFNDKMFYKSFDEVQFISELIDFKDYLLDVLKEDDSLILRQWREMVNLNHHTEVVIEISQFFGLYDLAKQFNEIADRQEKNGYLVMEDFEKRYELRKEMFEKIENIIGKENIDLVLM